jgi:tetratricopeptide (TPR) repeat protein
MDPITGGVLSCLAYDGLRKGYAKVSPDRFGQEIQQAAERVVREDDELRVDHFLVLLESDAVAEEVTALKEDGEQPSLEVFEAELEAIAPPDAMRETRETLELFLKELEKQLRSRPEIWRSITLSYIQDQTEDIKGLQQTIKNFESELGELADVVSPSPIEAAREGLADQGFSWITEREIERQSVNPDYCWQRAFNLAEVREEIPVKRRFLEEDRPTLFEKLLDGLEDGGAQVVIGPPGSGKTTSAKNVALEWHDDIDRGPVLYRRGGEANRFNDPTALSQAIDVARESGPVLVVVDDFVRPDNAGIYAVLTKYKNTENVSFLFNSRTQEWRNRYNRLKDTSHVDLGSDFGDEIREVFESYVQPPIEVPPIDEQEIDKIIDRFESVTDQSVHFTAETIYDEIKGKRGVSPMLLLSYYLLLETDIESLVDETPLERNVSQVFAKVNPEMGGFDVSISRDMDLLRKISLLINILNLTETGIYPTFLHGIAETEEEHSQIASFIDSLEGTMLFGQQDDARYRTNHELWSTLYLERFAAETPSPDDREVFQRCVNSIFSLFGDEQQRKLVRQRADIPADILDTIADSETSLASDIVEEIFRIGSTRPKLAPLFGSSEESNINLPESIPEPTWVSVPRRRAMMFRDNGDFERAESELDEMKRRLEEANDDVEEMLSFYHTHRGTLHTRRNEYEQAIECYREALDIAQRLEDRHQVGNNLHNIGTMEVKLGRYSEARNHLERSFEIKDELNDDEDRAAVLRKLGELALNIGEYDAAEKKCARSLRIAQSQQDREGEAYAYFWLARTAFEREAYEKAESLFLKSYNIFEELGYADRQISILQNLGEVANKQQKYDIARERLESARKLSKDLGFKIEDTKALQELGQVELNEGNIEAALQYAQKCYQRYRNLDTTLRVLDTIDLISQIHLSNDDDAAAAEWATHGLELMDELENDQPMPIRQTLEKKLAQTVEEPENASILYRLGVQATREDMAETAIENFQLAWEQHVRDQPSDEQRRASLAAGVQLLLHYEAGALDAAEIHVEDIESYLKSHREDLDDAGEKCLAYLTGEADKLDIDPIEGREDIIEMTIEELQREVILKLQERIEFERAPILEQHQQALEHAADGNIKLAHSFFRRIVSQGRAEDDQVAGTRQVYHSSRLALDLLGSDVEVGEGDGVDSRYRTFLEEEGEKLTEPAKLVLEELADKEEDEQPELSPGELLAQHSDGWEEELPERWQAWMAIYGRRIGDPYLELHDILEIYEFGLRDIRNDRLNKARKHLREAWLRRDTLDKESNRFRGAIAAGVTYAALLTIYGQDGSTWTFDRALETEERIQAIVSEAAEYDIELTDPVETMIGVLSDADRDTSPIDIVADAGFEGTDINNLEAIVYRELLDNVQEHQQLQSRSLTTLHDQAIESIRSNDSARAKRELKAAWTARHDYEPGANDHIEALKAGVGYAAHLELMDATPESVTPQHILKTVKESEGSLPDHVRALRRYLETGITSPPQLTAFDNPESPEAEAYAILYQALSSDT